MMKPFPLLILAILLNSLFNRSSAQTYQVVVENQPFVFLENAALATTEAWGVPEFQVPIGFDFPFFDIVSNQFYSIDNSVGGVFVLNEDLEHLYVMVPFYASMIDRGYSQDSALSPITYQTIGEVGQRVFTLELKEAGMFYGREDDDAIYLDHISLQVRLYEATGDIEFHIGPYTILEEPEIIFDPFPGPIIGILADTENDPEGHIGESILLEGDPLNPIVRTDTVPVFVIWPIPENTVYRFSRMNTAVKEQATYTHPPLFFPNPTSGEIYLNNNLVDNIVYPIYVMDMSGKETRQWNTAGDISTARLAPGSYYVVVKTDHEVITERLVVVDGE